LQIGEPQPRQLPARDVPPVLRSENLAA
jgi:hypothetical protein